ncbi:C-C motif chemokine 21-like [Pristis pectinata]|uniref:C-C motif chemokine 21-like n=1 Tax=Pristis pectinata TaxID=685728 RepID=UPI00223CD496|nr:C-C motif chemokine 21-like [Pristis pectinata]
MNTVPTAILLLFAIAAALWSVSQAGDDGKSLMDCCLETSPKEIPMRIVKSYKVQEPGKGCNIPAVLFLTKGKRVLCAPPEEMWVIKLRKAINKKNKRKGTRKPKRKNQKN